MAGGTHQDDLEGGAVSFPVPLLLLLFNVCYFLIVFQEYGIKTVQWWDHVQKWETGVF